MEDDTLELVVADAKELGAGSARHTAYVLQVGDFKHPNIQTHPNSFKQIKHEREI
jgi:hypothetical protein